MVTGYDEGEHSAWLSSRSLTPNVDYMATVVATGMHYYLFKCSAVAMMFKLTWGG